MNETEEKTSCSKCGSSNISRKDGGTQTDHHQIDFMKSYWDYHCQDCGHNWEKEKD